MDTDSHSETARFQASLTPQRVRTFQIVAGAMLAGATVFLAVLLSLYFYTPPEQGDGDAPLQLLSIVHLAEGGISYLAAFFIYRFIGSRRGLAFLTRQTPAPASETPELGALFTGFLISAALLEGVALFGMVVCLLGVLDGSIRQQPAYWLNLVSYAVFMAFLLKTFPTKDRLEQRYRERFLQDAFVI